MCVCRYVFVCMLCVCMCACVAMWLCVCCACVAMWLCVCSYHCLFVVFLLLFAEIQCGCVLLLICNKCDGGCVYLQSVWQQHWWWRSKAHWRSSATKQDIDHIGVRCYWNCLFRDALALYICLCCYFLLKFIVVVFRCNLQQMWWLFSTSLHKRPKALSITITQPTVIYYHLYKYNLKS